MVVGYHYFRKPPNGGYFRPYKWSGVEWAPWMYRMAKVLKELSMWELERRTNLFRYHWILERGSWCGQFFFV